MHTYINLHTDYMETSIYIAPEICTTVRDPWQAHRPPRALRLKADTACGTNEFEYLTVLAFATLILPLRTISQLSNSCLKGCAMSCSMSFSLLYTVRLMGYYILFLSFHCILFLPLQAKYRRTEETSERLQNKIVHEKVSSSKVQRISLASRI